MNTSRLDQFISALTELVERTQDEAEILQAGRGLLHELVQQDDWLPTEYALPDAQRYQQYPLYVDPLGRFSVVSFVWGPGQATPVHDHTVWGLIGMLRGSESCQAYVPDAHGVQQPSGAVQTLLPGHVEAVSPRIGDVHKVWNALSDQASISIHVYGADIGQVQRWVYPPEGGRKAFVSGYSPARHNPLDPLVQALATPLPTATPADVRAALLQREEIALLDVREEDPFAQCHPLFAANLPLGRLEADAWRRVPRRDTRVVVYDNGEGLAEPAARLLQALGYSRVSLLAGGLTGWITSGGEVFKDVNVPSKSFGELVESHRHTPSLPAPEVLALIEQGADMVVLDARRFDEYQTMSIPTGISVPGAELVLRARSLAPNPQTQIIVNCAGRTRSIIGTQSLINAGIPNPVAALRNGTIGWTLADQTLDHGAARRFGAVTEAQRAQASEGARAVAIRAGVRFIDRTTLQALQAERHRTTHLLDVRTPQEYQHGHWPGATSAPGGQLVQETDHTVPVRGARVVLYDDDGVRACMSASWLAQMAWEVCVLDDVRAADLSETGLPAPALPAPLSPLVHASPGRLRTWLQQPDTLVVDVGASAAFVKGHIPGAYWLLRSRFDQDVAQLPAASRVVVTCADGRASRYAVAPLRARLPATTQVLWLAGGTQAWQAEGGALESGDARVLSERIDRYRRPYEGTDNAREAMQGYLDWEFGLVAQLGRDGTHGFHVI
jgi:predicted metal-dependent enzyme (double-stranded beta helix superfamily)/rhodanese-related sulfurtransferase